MSWWFAGYLAVRAIATAGQLWLLSRQPLGNVLPLFSAASVILSTVISIAILREQLRTTTFIGVGLAVAALLVLALPR